MGNETKYWIIDGGLRKGPLTAAEVRKMNLSGDTPIWRDGLENWVALRQLDEFSDMNRSTVPPIPSSGSGDNSYQRVEYRPEMPRTYLVWNILAILFCCLIPAIVGLVYSTKVSSRYSAGDYTGAEKASSLACTWLIISIVMKLPE